MSKANNQDLTGLLIENRFELISPIGNGGIATVYKAKHRQVDLVVAVKILNREAIESQSELERLKREAHALNSLFHPNIVKVYSFGILENGTAYLVLDYLEGRSLENVIEQSGIQEQNWLIDCFRQICLGLSCAHESGLIHRDLKPSNVMIVDNPEDGAHVKILDFGLAKTPKIAAKAEQKLTKVGEIQGSPLYMSPEQIQGQEADARSDIYSLGCLMYEALSGEPPLLGDTAIATFMKHIQQMPLEFAKLKKPVKVPTKLEQIVFRCVQKDPAKRFQTVHEIESALADCLS